ncbi:hypothetical protein ALC57_00692 [Trachymyrmex cornetzi]|uniref:Uncharacterized protein n=1 Tax=Trachymyrmex cornetzi TaxID=471704 RepID=A0A151JRP3_9HYME|nr:hypothetical protein ALC57_00692 [Trachymyrmex cornetzi]
MNNNFRTCFRIEIKDAFCSRNFIVASDTVDCRHIEKWYPLDDVALSRNHKDEKHDGESETAPQ